TCFLIVPRQDLAAKLQEQIKDLKNIKIIRNRPFQQVVKHCSWHTATLSTCCLEALTLGIPNVLLDIEGKTSAMYRHLVDSRFTHFVDTEEQYFSGVDTFRAYPKSEIRASNQQNFIPDYREHLRKALDEILPKN
ncbi:MAG: hypothetical protein JST68_01515, partial [Bacteroidetes bacterium]|nr:hypothetical protein [Bacteroidota bacterium]